MYPKKLASGDAGYFEFDIPQPIPFPQIEDLGNSCPSCHLVSSQSKLATPSANRQSGQGYQSGRKPLELAPLCPPSWVWDFGLRGVTNRSRKTPFTQHGEHQAQWYEFSFDDKRVNTLEPVTERAGEIETTDGYKVNSPWQINVAADEGM